MLFSDCPFGDGVKLHNAVVVGGTQGGEETRGDGEERYVLDIRVVFGRVGHDVVNIVVALPPPDGQATEEVGNQDSDTCVNVEVVGYPHMASIVSGED